MRALLILGAMYLAVGLTGCGAITEQDRLLARELMAQSGSNCIHISGGTMMGLVPMAGGATAGGWRGSISAAHSEDDNSIECTADRAGHAIQK